MCCVHAPLPVSCKNLRRQHPFTLIELVVTIAIIVLTVALVTAVFGKESPARQMSRMESDFRTY